MLKLFAKYASVGVINTAIHWTVFAGCFYIVHTNQFFANLTGFIVSVSFSFFMNAKFTFQKASSSDRYILYVGFMASLSAVVGWVADKSATPPLITLIVFSAVSLICGFIYSKFVVFRDVK